MTACLDSIASILQQPTFSLRKLIIGVLLVTSIGCGRTDSEMSPQAGFPGVDTQAITQHGKLKFVENLESGRRLSEKLGKPCLLFFTADWCTYCRQMEETAFTDSAVGDLSENFICVLVDADLHPEICQEFSVTGYPTIQFVSANGRVLNRLVGRQSAPNLAIGMRSALKRFAWLNDPDTRVR